jgi:hypothetical protein
LSVAYLPVQVATVAQSGQDPTTYMQSEATLVHFPYRLGFSALKGSLYVADYSNKAVRRFFVLPVCACANNYVPVPGANSCYNPSPRWTARQLPHCSPGDSWPICTPSAVASRACLLSLRVPHSHACRRQASSRSRASRRARTRAPTPRRWA